MRVREQSQSVKVQDLIIFADSKAWQIDYIASFAGLFKKAEVRIILVPQDRNQIYLMTPKQRILLWSQAGEYSDAND